MKHEIIENNALKEIKKNLKNISVKPVEGRKRGKRQPRTDTATENMLFSVTCT